jgi:hypothetical protein
VAPVKLVPVRVTVAPIVVLVGVKEVMVGAGGKTVKLVAEVTEEHGVFTVIVPEVAPTGTVTVILVAELTVKVVAAVPLKLTEVAPVRLVPVMVMLEPTAAETGLTDDIVLGDGGLYINDNPTVLDVLLVFNTYFVSLSAKMFMDLAFGTPPAADP